MALSVVAPSQHDIRARLKAQDEQDQLCNAFRVPLGLAPEKLTDSEDFSMLLCDGKVPRGVVDAVQAAGKHTVWAEAWREQQ